MGVIIGVLVGYALGTQSGEEGWAELSEAWTVIRSSEEVKDLVAGGLSMARDLLQRGAGIVAESLGGAPGGTPLRPVA